MATRPPRCWAFPEVLVPPDRPDEVAQVLARVRHGESVDHAETAHLCKDGRQITVSLTISPLRDAQGRIERSVHDCP